MAGGWSPPSVSPSPPPAPPAPPAPRRWPPGGSCSRCSGRFASVTSQTTSLNNSFAHSYKDSNNMPKVDALPPYNRVVKKVACGRPSVVGLPGADVEEESGWAGAGLCERELRALHRSVPALRRRDLDTLAIRQHFYPEGGWGWIICGAAFLVNLLSSGLQLAFGLLYIYALKQFGEAAGLMAACMGGLSVGVSLATAPLVVAVCRRKSTRLTAVLGGLLLALACLFTSFAVQLHQAMLSYGVVLGVGCGMVRETSSLMLGHYFRKRREFVEMVAQAGAGVGIALFSVFYKEAVGKLSWRLGLQAVTGLLVLGFFLGMVYRSASLYHPQRRAILHLKNQRKKVKEKKTHIRVPKPPFFDFSPLKSRTVQMLLLATGTAAFGLYTPVFYLALQGYKEGLEDSALVLLQTFLGFATALGCVGFGLVIVRPSSQCLISRQYLAQASMLGIGLSLLALSSVQGYHGYVLFVWLYGLCLGGFLYSVKMLTMERVRARHFTRAWGFVQGAKAIPVILGVPMTGYINQQSPRAGYYFSFATTIVGAILLFFVGFSKRPEPGNSINSNMTAATLTNGECICPGISPQLQRFNNNFNHCGSVNYGHYSHPVPMYSHPFYAHHHPHHSHPYGHLQNGLPKSLSFAAPLDYQHDGNYVSCMSDEPNCIYNCMRSPYHYRHAYNRGLRPSKSVPEGLARCDMSWSRGGSCRSSCRRPVIRNVQVIEQITTSV